MSTLSDDELKKIISWQPYRSDWPVDRNSKEDKIEEYFGDVMKFFKTNTSFTTKITEDGGMSNYLEFICYPNDINDGKIDAIMICLSLCAPIAIYGQISGYKEKDTFGWSFIKSENINLVESEDLKSIEQLLIPELLNKGIKLIETKEARENIPAEIYNNENGSFSLHEGNQLFHAIFQVMD